MAEQKNVTSIVSPIVNSKRYITNGAAYGLTCPVRVHETLDISKLPAFFATSDFQARMQKITHDERAVAIDAHWNVMSIGFPTNLLGIQPGGAVTGSVVSADISTIAAQLHKIVDMYGTQQSGVSSPMKKGRLTHYSTEGNKAHFTVELQSGQIAVITVELQSAK